jgi:hypothetical protein
MLTRPVGRPKNRWEDNIRNNIKKLEIKNWTSCIAISGNCMLRRPNLSKNEVVAPKEEKETLENFACLSENLASLSLRRTFS